MSFLTFIRKHPIWVFLALLAYSVQSFASAESVLTMYDEPQPGCHMEHHTTDANAPTMPASDIPNVMDCCGDDCDMATCYAGSAILNQVLVPIFNFGKTKVTHYDDSPLLAILDTQYRPPILG
ncbi:MAG: hypothetical protein COA42_22430 [Alteromonadaceae bacterium]|nr:MAG: hypothetical protein COA42_22430 [Alteromonadaceae bacterium]